MISQFRIALADPVLRVPFLCILLMGPAVASILPFQSVVGIERLGMSDAAYAALVTFGSLFSVVASVTVGILTDQTGRYRSILLGCILVGILAGALMFALPSIPSFVTVHALLFPIAATTFTQYFALAALAAERNPNLDKDVGLSLVRAGFSGTFAITPPLWALAFARGVDLLSIYGLLLVANIFVLMVVLFFWPKTPVHDDSNKSGLSFFEAVKEVAARRIQIRLVLISVVSSSNGLYNILLGLLIINALGGTEADVGWFAGLVALVEIPVMLYGAALVQRYNRLAIILTGTLIYGLSLAALGQVPSMAWAWALIVPFGIGAGIILSVPVAYIQGLVAHRPGAGSSLLAMSHFGGTMMASAIFAAGTKLFDYSGVAILGFLIALIAAVILRRID